MQIENRNGRVKIQKASILGVIIILVICSLSAIITFLCMQHSGDASLDVQESKVVSTIEERQDSNTSKLLGNPASKNNNTSFFTLPLDKLGLSDLRTALYSDYPRAFKMKCIMELGKRNSSESSDIILEFIRLNASEVTQEVLLTSAINEFLRINRNVSNKFVTLLKLSSDDKYIRTVNLFKGMDNVKD